MRLRTPLLAAVVAGVVLAGVGVTAAAATPYNTLVGWGCEAPQDGAVACELWSTDQGGLVGENTRPGALTLGVYPLSDFTGLTVAQLVEKNNVDVLRRLLNIRQESAISMAASGGWDIAPEIQALLGPDLSVDVLKWTAADGLTEGLAGGPVPPVPAMGTPPAAGQCWAFQVPKYSLTPLAITCVAPDGTVDSSGIITWPGYPAPQPVVAPLQAATSTVSSAAATVAKTVGVAPSTASSKPVEQPAAAPSLPTPKPSTSPTPPQVEAQAAAAVDTPPPAGGQCTTDKVTVPCTQDPSHAHDITPQVLSDAHASLVQQAKADYRWHQALWGTLAATVLAVGAVALKRRQGLAAWRRMAP